VFLARLDKRPLRGFPSFGFGGSGLNRKRISGLRRVTTAYSAVMALSPSPKGR
jgi:hypothetical protein